MPRMDVLLNPQLGASILDADKDYLDVPKSVSLEINGSVCLVFRVPSQRTDASTQHKQS